MIIKEKKLLVELLIIWLLKSWPVNCFFNLDKNGHSYEVDIWSIGVIAYALLFGRPPFETNDLKLTYSKIKSCNYSFPDNVNASASVKKFITKILQL